MHTIQKNKGIHRFKRTVAPLVESRDHLVSNIGDLRSRYIHGIHLLHIARNIPCTHTPGIHGDNITFQFFCNDQLTLRDDLRLESAVSVTTALQFKMTRLEASYGLFCLPRSEEHTSELQSRENLVYRLLLD